jgi:hypothetical protein
MKVGEESESYNTTMPCSAATRAALGCCGRERLQAREKKGLPSLCDG